MEGAVKVAILKRLCIPCALCLFLDYPDESCREYTEEGINDQMELAVSFLGDLQRKLSQRWSLFSLTAPAVLIDPCYSETASELIETIVHLLRFANPEVM